jgi:hypothetical protein
MFDDQTPGEKCEKCGEVHVSSEDMDRVRELIEGHKEEVKEFQDEAKRMLKAPEKLGVEEFFRIVGYLAGKTAALADTAILGADPSKPRMAGTDGIRQFAFACSSQGCAEMVALVRDPESCEPELVGVVAVLLGANPLHRKGEKKPGLGRG